MAGFDQFMRLPAVLVITSDPPSNSNGMRLAYRKMLTPGFMSCRQRQMSATHVPEQARQGGGGGAAHATVGEAIDEFERCSIPGRSVELCGPDLAAEAHSRFDDESMPLEHLRLALSKENPGVARQATGGRSAGGEEKEHDALQQCEAMSAMSCRPGKWPPCLGCTPS